MMRWDLASSSFRQQLYFFCPHHPHLVVILELSTLDDVLGIAHRAAELDEGGERDLLHNLRRRNGEETCNNGDGERRKQSYTRSHRRVLC